MVKMYQSAMVKVGQIFNQLRKACGCAACARCDVEAFEFVGTYSAASFLARETKRNRTFENTASGVAMAKGLRDPTLPDKDRREPVAEPNYEQADAQGAAVGPPIRALFFAGGAGSDHARPGVK